MGFDYKGVEGLVEQTREGDGVQQLLNFIWGEKSPMSVRIFLAWQIIFWVLATINALKL